MQTCNIMTRAMQAALTVVMAASGYPGSYEKGSIIRNLDAVCGAKVPATTHTYTRRIWMSPSGLSISSARCPWLCRYFTQGRCQMTEVTSLLPGAVCLESRQQAATLLKRSEKPMRYVLPAGTVARNSWPHG